MSKNTQLTPLKFLFLLVVLLPFDTIVATQEPINDSINYPTLSTNHPTTLPSKSDNLLHSLQTIPNSSSQAIPTYSKQSKVSSNYTMNQIVNFWVEDLGKARAGDTMPGYMYRISAEVLNITQNAYILVDTNLTSYYDKGLASSIGLEFETQIQPSDTRLGTSSDIDHNGKIIILIFYFREGAGSTYTTGYFWPLHMYNTSTDPNSPFYYSEHAEIIHVNDRAIEQSGSPLPVTDWAPTLAHEYFHLIHYKYNSNEDLWLEEGLAVFAEHLAGFESGYLSYLQDTNGNGYFLHAFDYSLTYFGQTLEHYGESFLFVLYFYQRFGLSFIKDIIQTTVSGVQAFKDELVKMKINESFDHIYSDWMLTNLVNDPTNKIYSYTNFTFKITQYNVDKQLIIIPSQFTQQILPFWSSQFYDLPQNNLAPYEITFQPELPNNNATYQIEIATEFSNNTWSFAKIPLINVQSGSFIVQYQDKTETKILLISSLTGTSSGVYSIDDSEMFTTYFSRYNLYLDAASYFVNYGLLGVQNLLPTYNFTISTVSGEKIPFNGVRNITLSVYKWNETNPIAGITPNIFFNSSSQYWTLVSSAFNSLPMGQYYFTLTIRLVNDQVFTSRGLTFLLQNSTTTSTGFQNLLDSAIYPAAGIGVSLIVVITIVNVLRRKKKKN